MRWFIVFGWMLILAGVILKVATGESVDPVFVISIAIIGMGTAGLYATDTRR